MKKLVLAAFALSTAVSVFAQGTVQFSNRSSLGITHVYGPGTNPYQSLVGLGPNDTPTPGSTDYAGAGMTLIGANGINGAYSASGTWATLLGANGANQPESSLTPQGATTTFRTGAAAGNIVANLTYVLASIPKDSPAATLEMVAWDNSSGLYSTWALASVAWLNGTIAAGKSGAFNISNVGGVTFDSPLTTPTSFNLYYIPVPEPSTFALAGLGAAAMLIFRRRK